MNNVETFVQWRIDVENWRIEQEDGSRLAPGVVLWIDADVLYALAGPNDVA